MKTIKKILSIPIDWFLYTLLNDQQRKTISNLFSDNLKDKLKRVISGKKLIERNKLQQIKFYLYNVGMEKRGLEELIKFYHESKDNYIKRLSAWELVLWHANQYTEEDATKALTYIPLALEKEKNKDQLRRIAIVQAECLSVLGKTEEARQIIQDVLVKNEHPDLYFAMANIEESIMSRLSWINKVFEYYQLTPISFSNKVADVQYDDLSSEVSGPFDNSGPKVTIILPAYNAEVGIQTAINSLLAQTWQNFELLIVDDCSTDGTVKVVQEYVEKDSRIKLLQTPTNSGPYVARNIGLMEATGEFVTINDSDDWSHPQKIEKQVKHLMQNSNIIANTSGHARLTEDIKLYRRGTPGKYIFPNMSSIMFKRKPVMEKLGFWDSVRFAADGEFKRRFLKEFGKERYVDLNSGPLSLPRQSVSSLTGSSAFGYNGFFKGARKEYVESFEYYHKQAINYVYDYPQQSRLYPVPEPMWPQREAKSNGKRDFDIVIVTDFRIKSSIVLEELTKSINSFEGRIGLVQMYHYDLDVDNLVHDVYRNKIDGNKIHMLVYGEKVRCDKLIVINPIVLQDYQEYIPELESQVVEVVVTQLPVDGDERLYQITDCVHNLNHYFDSSYEWIPYDSMIRTKIQQDFQNEFSHITLSSREWT